jgi:hypothetical protein
VPDGFVIALYVVIILPLALIVRWEYQRIKRKSAMAPSADPKGEE